MKRTKNISQNIPTHEEVKQTAEGFSDEESYD